MWSRSSSDLILWDEIVPKSSKEVQIQISTASDSFWTRESYVYVANSNRVKKKIISIVVCYKWNSPEFTEFSEFKESDKSLKYALGSI